jgi:hypothetical protein
VDVHVRQRGKEVQASGVKDVHAGRVDGVARRDGGDASFTDDDGVSGEGAGLVHGDDGGADDGQGFHLE